MRVRARGQASGFTARHHGSLRRCVAHRLVWPRPAEAFTHASCHQTYPPVEVTVQRGNAVPTVMLTVS